MRAFLKKLSFFFFIVLLICWGITEVKIPDWFIIKKTKDNAFKKIAWNIDFINKHPEKIKGSVVFLGTSVTQGGISDSLLTANGIHAINFGISDPGNMLSLYFLNKIIDLKPEKIIVEKAKHDVWGVHKLLPLLCTPSQLVCNEQRINVSFSKFFYKRVRYVLEYVWNVCSSNKKEEYTSGREYGELYHVKSASEKWFLAKSTYENCKKADELSNVHLNDYTFMSERGNNSYFFQLKKKRRKWLHNFWFRFDYLNNSLSQKYFVEKMQSICENNSIEFSRLYIPILMDVKTMEGYNRVEYTIDYEKENVLALKNHKMLNKYTYWHDMHHLSKKGALVYTQQLIDEGVFRK